MTNKIKVDYIKGEIIERKEQEVDKTFLNIPENEKTYEYVIDTKEGTQTVDAMSTEYKVGDNVFIQKIYINQAENSFAYGLLTKNRELEVFSLILIFILFIFVLFGKKGIKALVSLAISILIIFKILLPLTLSGYNPVIAAGSISMLLLGSSMLITHGRNKISLIAFLSCSLSVFITIGLSYFIIFFSRIAGYVDEYSMFLKFGLDNPVNVSLLVIASIIIGVIGAVDDASVTQAKIVAELKSLNNKLKFKEYYKRAMNIGNAHAGSMINTLIFAYIASSFPVLIYLYTSEIPFRYLLSQEMVVVEIFRSIIASIGLLLAIPITTWFSVYFIKDKDLDCKDVLNEYVCHHHHN